MKSKTTKTKAIALRTIEVTNTSAIVVWLTADNGRLATMIKGAYRPKSMFLGRFDLFYTCELIYYTHAREHLHSIRECSPLRMHPSLRTNWRACAAASYCCDLIGKVTPWGAPHPELYSLLEDKLNELDGYGLNIASIFWFELRLMELLGLAPRLDSCASCGTRIDHMTHKFIFSDEHGGLLCNNCHTKESRSELPLSRGAVSMLLQWQGLEEPSLARRTRCSHAQKEEIEILLGRFLRYHLESDLQSRDVAFEIFSAV